MPGNCPQRGRLLAGFALLLLSTTHALAAAGDGFIRHRSLDPLTATFGLPAVAARVGAGEGQLQLAFEHGSIFTGGRTSDEVLRLDGETSRLALRYTRAVTECLTFGVAGEAVAHGGGIFDAAIDDWHQWFGLPDAGRDQAPMDVLNFRYENADGSAFAVNGSAQGMGDISVSVARTWRCDDQAGPLLRFGLKLPTGERGTLLGSGTTDVYADVQSPWWSAGLHWRFAASGGLLKPGTDSDTEKAFPDQQAVVGYASAVTVFRFSRRGYVVAQLDARTAVFDSPLRELGDASLVLTTGLRALSSPGNAFELTIAEDVAIDTAPDIVLRLGWTHRL